MPTITRLVAGKRNPNRVNIYLDGRFAFTLSLDEVVKQGFKKGVELSDEQITTLKESDATEYVYAKLLNFLSYRPRTIKEVRDRLYKYEVRESVKQNALIARLQEKGYLDDISFAKWFIASRNANKPRSARQIRSELSAKGVSRDVINEVIKDVAGEEETIMGLLSKKLGAKRVLATQEKQKICAFLARRGFAWEKVTKVVKCWQSE